MRQKLIIIAIILVMTSFLTGCTKKTVDCEILDEKECLEHQDTCSLCPKTLISSYAECHTREYCKNIPFDNITT